MKKILTNGLAQLDITSTEHQQNNLLKFIELLVKWNKVYNLTAVREPEAMLNLHLFDSLSLLPYLGATQRLLDVGSGAGLPGIPLAIFRSDINFVLLDSNVKKTRFIQQAIVELGLKNVQVAHERAEKYHTNEPFDCITTRAFATIAETLNLITPLLEAESRILFMKSNTAESELSELNSSYHHKVIELTVPGISANRCLVVLSRSSSGKDQA